MAQSRMLGVVLWCDAAKAKAVIWCEDHGKLAYYTPAAASGHDGAQVGAVAGFDAGDLVRFDLSEEEDQLRYAHNPEVLSDLAYPTLAQVLSTVQPTRNQNKAGSLFNETQRPAPANSDSVIDFSKAVGARVCATA